MFGFSMPRSRPSLRAVVTAAFLAAVCPAPSAQAQTPPAPQPTVEFQPAKVPWPLSWAQARKAARAEAVRAWDARKPKVVSLHRISFSKVDCRVRWRTTTGAKRARTVRVKRTSTYDVQAFPAP